MKDIGRCGRDTGNNRQGFVDRASNENDVDDDEDYDSDGDFDMTFFESSSRSKLMLEHDLLREARLGIMVLARPGTGARGQLAPARSCAKVNP